MVAFWWFLCCVVVGFVWMVVDLLWVCEGGGGGLRYKICLGAEKM